MSTLKLAWRNVWRAPRRTVLTSSSIAVALGLFVFMLAWVQGFLDYALESTTQSWSGMAQIQSRTWIETEESTETLPDGEALLERIRIAADVTRATPRAYGEAMAAMGDRTAAVQLVGIELDTERQTTNFSEKIARGDWPTGDTQVLIGVTLAEELELGVGDKLALTAADIQTGELNSLLVRISGLLSTSNSFLDRRAVLGALPTVQRLLGLEERFHEITLFVAAPILDEVAIESVVDRFESESVEARAWQQIQADIAEGLKLQRKVLWLAVLIVFLIAAFGVVNTMTMSFLERFREFGILRAIGTSPARIFGLIVCEAGWIGALGVGAGTLMALLLIWPLSIYGLNVGGAEAYGVSFDRNILFRLDVPQTIALVTVFFVLTVFTGALTARRAARIQPVEALRQG